MIPNDYEFYDQKSLEQMAHLSNLQVNLSHLNIVKYSDTRFGEGCFFNHSEIIIATLKYLRIPNFDPFGDACGYHCPYFLVAVKVTTELHKGGWKPIFDSSAQSEPDTALSLNS